MEADGYYKSILIILPVHRASMNSTRGMAVKDRLSSARRVLPQPHPSLSYIGNMLRGVNAPPIELATVCAAKADAQ